MPAQCATGRGMEDPRVQHLGAAAHRGQKGVRDYNHLKAG